MSFSWLLLCSLPPKNKQISARSLRSSALLTTMLTQVSGMRLWPGCDQAESMSAARSSCSHEVTIVVSTGQRRYGRAMVVLASGCWMSRLLDKWRSRHRRHYRQDSKNDHRCWIRTAMPGWRSYTCCGGCGWLLDLDGELSDIFFEAEAEHVCVMIHCWRMRFCRGTWCWICTVFAIRFMTQNEEHSRQVYIFSTGMVQGRSSIFSASITTWITHSANTRL